MVERRSSVSLPRIGDGAATPRRLRLRGDARLVAMLVAGRGADESARLEVPSREAVALGDAVLVEIGLGALVDEVELDGVVVELRARDGGQAPLVVIAIPARHAAQLSYVESIVRGDRAPMPRAHRRIPCDVAVRWQCGELRQDSRARDLSRGGAFVLSHLQPLVGAMVTLEFEATATSPILRLQAQVSWIQRNPHDAGFGVHFVVRTREEAEHVQRMLRAHESAS
ncbi:MAG: PilZ domain-containing protein [Deltaproteobacteria bacterium]|nr:PilZ domain-containing protein [Deltaproteobacteria bacterium]